MVRWSQSKSTSTRPCCREPKSPLRAGKSIFHLSANAKYFVRTDLEDGSVGSQTSDHWNSWKLIQNLKNELQHSHDFPRIDWCWCILCPLSCMSYLVKTKLILLAFGDTRFQNSRRARVRTTQTWTSIAVALSLLSRKNTHRGDQIPSKRCSERQPD